MRAAVRRRPGRAHLHRQARRRSRARTCSCSPLDDRRRWFRFHHLFAQILRVELAKREPALVATLHRRAFEWHRDYGTTDEAIHHAVAAKAFTEASELITQTWVHYANAGRIESVNEWLAHVPDDGDQRLLLARAWVSALRGREADMRAAATKARVLGDLDDGPLPDGFVSVESSLNVLEATFGWGDVNAILTHGERSEKLEPPDSPWRPVITWALGWAHYCNGDLDQAERWLTETTEIAPAAEQWIVGVAAIADLSLIAGLRGRRAEQLRLAEEAVEVTRTAGLLDAVEDGEVHTAYGVGARRPRAPSRSPDLAREGRLPAPSVGAEARPDRRADRAREHGRRAGRPRARRRAAGRGAGARRPLRRPGGAPGAHRRGEARPTQPISDDDLSERELTVLRLLASELSEREIAAELYLSFNTVHSHVKSIYRKLGVSSRAEAVARIHLGR